MGGPRGGWVGSTRACVPTDHSQSLRRQRELEVAELSFLFEIFRQAGNVIAEVHDELATVVLLRHRTPSRRYCCTGGTFSSSFMLQTNIVLDPRIAHVFVAPPLRTMAASILIQPLCTHSNVPHYSWQLSTGQIFEVCSHGWMSHIIAAVSATLYHVDDELAAAVQRRAPNAHAPLDRRQQRWGQEARRVTVGSGADIHTRSEIMYSYRLPEPHLDRERTCSGAFDGYIYIYIRDTFI